MIKGERNRRRFEYRRTDLAALLLGAALFAYFLFTARYAEIDIDEAAYLGIPQRLMHGDRLIIDDWGIPQFSFLPMALPYRAFVRITGSADGVLLFMRIFFICTWALFYVYLYKRLRGYGAWGLAGAFLFCALAPQTIMSHSYFTVSAMAAAAVGCELLPENRPKSPVRLFALGAALAVGVMAEPLLILLFLAWSILTALKELPFCKNRRFLEGYAFLLNKKTFLPVTAGAACVFAAFMAMLGAMGSLRELPAVLPYLLSDSDYNAKTFFDVSQYLDALEYYGFVFLAAQMVCVAVSLALRARGKLTAKRKTALFAAACAILAMSYVYAGIRTAATGTWDDAFCFIAFHNVPLLLFSPIPFLLIGKRSERFFAFWLLGMGYTLLVDLSSGTNVGTGGSLVRIPTLLQTAALLPELRADETPKKGKTRGAYPQNARAYRMGTRIAAVCAALALVWDFGFIWIEGMEKGFTEVRAAPDGCDIEAGPYKGMKMPAGEAAIYRDVLQDLDYIKARADGGRVCVPDMSCFPYLYLDLPYASFNMTYKNGNLERLYEYWLISDSHRPDWIYLPQYEFFFFEHLTDEYMDDMLARLREYIDCEATAGKAGYIIRVTALKAPAQTPADEGL